MNGRDVNKPVATVRVALGARGYDIVIGAGLLSEIGPRLAPLLKRPVTAIVTDDNVAAHHLAALETCLRTAGISSTAIVLPPGEATKSYAQLATVCDRLLAASIERRDTVIAFGGGVIGDLAGFAAAILRRGVSFVQIPTTLLAQVDSSVGGKTGINSPYGKNLIGAFHQPIAVFTDTALLDTLPRRELAAGYAEIAKCAALGDAAFFDWLDANLDALFAGDPALRARSIEVSCAAKARIVAEDETETGIRALLNLGHTFGHALEAATFYSARLLHGEAVAIGMVQAARFSEQLGVCSPGTADRLAAHLRRAGLPDRASQIPGSLPPPAQLLDIMRQDKKASAGRLTFILLRRIGEAFIAKDVDEAHLLAFLEKDLRATMNAPLWLVLALTLAIAAFAAAIRICLAALTPARLAALRRLDHDRTRALADLLGAGAPLHWALALIENCAKVAAAAAAALLIALHQNSHWLAAAIVAGLCVLAVGPILLERLVARAPERIALTILPVLGMTADAAGPAYRAIARLLAQLPHFPRPSRHPGAGTITTGEARAISDIHLRTDEAEKKDRAMLGGLLNLSALEVSDVMIHRTKMVTIDAADPPDRIISAVLKSGHTRIPIYRDRPDNILGILNARDLFAALQEAHGDAGRIDVEKIAKPAWFVPDTRPISDQLNAFLKRKTHFALVVDEYGEVMGLITLEDILEEIVGDIVDEHDAMASGVRPHADGTFTIDGTVPIRDLNRVLEWDLPDDEATTLAGLVVHEARMIPDPGQAFTFHGFRFEVLRKRRHQVTSLKVTPVRRPAAIA